MKELLNLNMKPDCNKLCGKVGYKCLIENSLKHVDIKCLTIICK